MMVKFKMYFPLSLELNTYLLHMIDMSIPDKDRK